MGLAIFDKDAPVLTDLSQSFTREQASVDSLGEPVASNAIRHAPLTRIAARSARVTADSTDCRMLGGNALLVTLLASGLSYQIRRANADGTASLVRTLTRGVVLAGSSRLLNAALGNPTGYDAAEVEGNLALTNIRAASEHLGILRIYVEVHRFNGTIWQSAAHAMFFSLDEGATWTQEYRSENHNLGNSRGREWCINPVGTPLYNRTGTPLIVAYGDSDYLFKSDGSSPVPDEARHFLSVFIRSSASDPWVHSFALAFPEFESTDHGHNAIALEYPHAGGNGIQVVCSMGDGVDKNAVKRFVWDGDINPATPATLTGAQDIVNWTLDTGWTHGTLTGKGTYGNQWTAAFFGPEEGTACVLYDNETGFFGIMEAGDDDAVAPVFKTRGPIHPGGRGITLFAGTDGTGKITMAVWDDVLPAYNTERMMYSPDWGESWTEFARLSDEDSRSCMAHGRLFWAEGGSSPIYSRVLPTTRLVRPACVSPAGINRFYQEGTRDLQNRIIDWLPFPTTTGVTYTKIQKADGVFTDPDTSEVIPAPPCLSDWIMKITTADPTMEGSSIGVLRFGRGNDGNELPTNERGQADERVWFLPALDSQGALVRTQQATTQGVADLWNQEGSGSGSWGAPAARSFHKIHGRDRWYPAWAGGRNATNLTDQLQSGNRYAISLVVEGNNPAARSFYVVPDFTSWDGGGRVGQPIPLGTGTSAADSEDGSAPDEVLTLTGIDLNGETNAVRVVCRIPWDSWNEWSERGVCGTKTLWRLFADADNWIVAEWEGGNRRLRVRVRSGGTTRTALTLHSTTAAMRETVIDIALGIDGDNLALAASVAGETETGTVTGGALFAAAVDQWRAGADETGAISAIEVMAVETFAAGGDAAAMATLLESIIPGPVIVPPVLRLTRGRGGGSVSQRFNIKVIR